MTELSTMRPACHGAKSGITQPISQTIDPASIAPQSTGRPWNSRAALQIMPQATNRSALAAPGGSGGEIMLSMLQIATENPPSRYALPHQASARMRSCAQADNKSNPSNPVMQLAATNNVVTSSVIGALTAGESMSMTLVVVR